MFTAIGLLGLAAGILLATAIGVIVIRNETRAERRAWRDAPEEYCAEEGADR